MYPQLDVPMSTPLPANPRPEPPADAMAWLSRRTRETDLLVGQAFDEFLAVEVPTGLSILAVGGYGRGELFPFSDIDLLLLFENDRLAQSAKAAVGDFLQWLWDLKWERTSAYNVGVDFALFKGRLTGNIEGYYKITRDLLIPRQLPNVTGYSSVFSNLGQIDNKGIEIDLVYRTGQALENHAGSRCCFRNRYGYN